MTLPTVMIIVVIMVPGGGCDDDDDDDDDEQEDKFSLLCQSVIFVHIKFLKTQK